MTACPVHRGWPNLATLAGASGMAGLVTEMAERHSDAFAAGVYRRAFANADLLRFWPRPARSGVTAHSGLTRITVTQRYAIGRPAVAARSFLTGTYCFQAGRWRPHSSALPLGPRRLAAQRAIPRRLVGG